jgi:hypothetical protein
MTTLGERSPRIDTATSGAAVTPMRDLFVPAVTRDMLVLVTRHMPVLDNGRREMRFSSRKARTAVTTATAFSSVQATATLAVSATA